MACKDVKEDKEYTFVGSLLGEERREKPSKSTIDISGLSYYKNRELDFIRLHGIRFPALNTLIGVVDHYCRGINKVTIHQLLSYHGYSVGYYHCLYNRLFNLSKRGLVSCDKVELNSGSVLYFYPTEKGLQGVLGLLDK